MENVSGTIVAITGGASSGLGANIRTTIISPGAIDTELPASVKAPGVAEGIADFYEKLAIRASSFGRCALFAINQPDDMDVNEILYRPTAQVG